MNTRLKCKQLQDENESFRRLLKFLLQENSILKTRLAELLPEQGVSEEFLETMELYQTQFIQKDEIINLMRQDIQELDDLVDRYNYEDGSTSAIIKKQEKLRSDVRKLVDAIEDLKTRFNRFLEMKIQ